MKQRHQQQGVALLTALLLVVAITIIAGSIIASQKLAIRQSGLLFEQNQVLHGINAGTEFAIELLNADAKLNQTDSIQDIWAKPIPPYDFANQKIQIEIKDEASKFNINNLYHDGAVDEQALQYFQRLLTNLNLNPKLAIAILDWQDPDNQVYQDGGDEQTLYGKSAASATQTQASITVPNRPFVSIDELINIPNINAQTLRQLSPYITAVPYYLPINVNTASAEVLSALSKDLPISQVQAVIQQRERTPFNSMDEFWQVPIFANLEEKDRPSSLLSTQSQAFLGLITVRDVDNHERYASILLKKNMGNENTLDKKEHHSAQSGTTDVNQENTPADTNANSDKTKVELVSRRLWAFRPNLW